MIAIYFLLSYVILILLVRFKLWKIKHENTAWHGAAADDDELDVPDWEDIKGRIYSFYLVC
jgi:hypothetical protein